MFWGHQLPFANRMYHFYASDRTVGRPKRLETQHGTREPLHCSMVLLHNIIEILGVALNNGGLVRLVVVRDRCRIAATLVDRDLLGEPLVPNRFT